MAGPRRAASKDAGKDEDALAGARILVVEGRYYDEIADELLAGAKRALDAAKVGYDVATVPGALEIPQAMVIVLNSAFGAEAYDGDLHRGPLYRQNAASRSDDAQIADERADSHPGHRLLVH